MKALVLGYGRSGVSAEALLKECGYDVVVLANDGQSFPSAAFRFAVVSPGIALTHPWIVMCRERGIPLKSELQLGCEELRKRGWKLLGVTGSKGKSSVVKLVAETINHSGDFAVPCGNYGRPVSDVACNESRIGWAIVEVSSFMLETTNLERGTFDAVTILNLQEDHLDRHGSVEAYHALKRKLLTMAKDGEDVQNRSLPEGVDEIMSGSYFDNPVLRCNGLAAIALLSPLKLPTAVLKHAFSGFVPLPHRMNLVATIGGVHYLDDSKATSLAALEAGIKMVHPDAYNQRNVRLIAGGLPKGDDPKSVLSILTKRVKKVYLIGQSAESFGSAWKTAAVCEVCGTMERAVQNAMREAAKGETVLLSPGAASFDQFKSFEERGDVFANLVKSQRIK